MTIKSIFAAGVLSIAAVASTVGITTAAQAGTKIQVYLGGGYYEPEPVYHYREPVCAWWEDCGFEGEHFVQIERPHRERFIERRHRREVIEDRVSCRSALRMVSRRGFHDVRTRDCEGTSYRFVGWKHGHQYMVKVNARTGSFNAYPL
jgi:hypothetical protein